MTNWRPAYVGVVPSTMDEVLRAAVAGAPEGTTIIAESLTAGRGRRGRVWVAPPGAGLWMTTLLRPEHRTELHTLSLVAGIAVLDAVHDAGAHGVRLKWPNDLVVNVNGWRKLAGILLQADAAGAEPIVLVGIGVNLVTDTLPPDLAAIATSMAALGVRACTRDSLAAAVLMNLQRAYEQWCAEGFAPFVDTWNHWNAFAGTAVDVDGIAGCDLGIDVSGGLRLQTAAGVVRLVAGDVRITA